MPTCIRLNGEIALRYRWDGLKLLESRDEQTGRRFVFEYNKHGPERVTVYGDMGWCGQEPFRNQSSVTLDIDLDQVGTIRVLSYQGMPVKYLDYDSFGQVIQDTLIALHLPLGFAGGLVDPFTGFTRFGFRDYDPASGRFTAKDPLGDTGGDHDLWEYCVDDPVSFKDPMGLNPLGLLWRFGSKSFLKSAAKKTLGLIVADANAPEELIDVRRQMGRLGNAGHNSPEFNALKEREIELWDEFGNHYLNNFENSYGLFIPEAGYTDRIQRRLEENRRRAEEAEKEGYKMLGMPYPVR